MTVDHIATDSNILLYLHDKSDKRKRDIAKNILSDNPQISTQVISEFINVARRQLDMPKADMVAYCADLLKDCQINSVSWSTLITAASLIRKYDFQIFDSIIVAAALESNCAILYSEDMQHGLKVNSLTILNPFK
ncbi:MAG: PIN domain-containing protein [Bacteroidota bacterium]